jgi:hypothetical protein
MKRSLSFADLKTMGPAGPTPRESQSVRKIQSCAGRFQESDDLSPDFFDDLLDEFESPEGQHHSDSDLQQHNQAPETAPSQPMFTTHDLTALLSFLQPNPLPPQAKKNP